MIKNLQQVLRARAAMEKAVRAYFTAEGFVEVTTPIALPHPNLDPNVVPVPVSIRDFSGFPSPLWLHTSPELSMKKLLSMGSGSIFQIGPVFRDGEKTRLHRQEFSMLEWYRTGADYRDVIKDLVNIFRAAADAVRGSEVIEYSGKAFDLGSPWEEITMAEAFRSFAGIDSWNLEELQKSLEKSGGSSGPFSSVQNLFFKVYVERVEPELGRDRPVIVKDFPAFLGTMARPSAGNPEVLERFESYIGGVELANGYTELADREELGRRMETARLGLEAAGTRGLTVDRDFLEAMAQMPPCAGVSVGMDRLAMILLGARDIAQVVFPFEEETT